MHDELMRRKILALAEGALRACGSGRSTEKKQLLREARNAVEHCTDNFNQEFARKQFKSIVWAAAIHRNTGFFFGGKYREKKTKTISYILRTLNSDEDLLLYLFPTLTSVDYNFLRANYHIADTTKSKTKPKTVGVKIVPKGAAYLPDEEDLPETFSERNGIIVTRYRTDKILYRGDTRSPDDLVRSGGFLPNISLSADRNNENVLSELGTHFPARISFTSEQDVAMRYLVRVANRQQAERSYMYYVNVRNMEVIDLNRNLEEGRLGRSLSPERRARLAQSWVDEKLVIGNRIPVDRIMTVIEYTANRDRVHCDYRDCYDFNFHFEYKTQRLRSLLGI